MRRHLIGALCVCGLAIAAVLTSLAVPMAAAGLGLRFYCVSVMRRHVLGTSALHNAPGD